MFVSLPQFESPVPHALAVPDAKYWRTVQLSCAIPWFIAMFDVREDGEWHERTLCLCWHTDLMSLIASTDANMCLVSLQLMMPPWLSATAVWSSREIRKVWLVQDADRGEVLVLADPDGREFYGSYAMDVPEDLGERLLIASFRPRNVPGKGRPS